MIANKYISKGMRTKIKPRYQEQRGGHHSSYSSTEQSPSTKPIHSPSPDKKAANIITYTRSPDLHDIKNMHLLERQPLISSWHSHQEYRQEKQFSVQTPLKIQTNSQTYKMPQTQPSTRAQFRYIESDPRQFSPVSNSRVRNTRIQIVAQGTPEDFETKQNLSRIKQLNRSDSMELDYIKLLRSKEETIRELKDIIEMIKKNNTSSQDVDQSQEKITQYRQKINQLNAQVKELTIENQHLLNAIERNKKGSNLSGTPVKDEILQRQIRQLKATIEEKDRQIRQASHHYEQRADKLKNELNRLENENQSLMRILKQKQQTLGNSSLSVQSKSSQRQKLSLYKIKQQYSENVKLMKQNFYRQIQDISEAYHYQLEQLSTKLDEMTSKVSQLQFYRAQIDRKRSNQDAERVDIREEYHKEKIRHQEIQSLMLQRNNKFENQVVEQKKTNERLIQELIKANKIIEDVNQKLMVSAEQIQKLKEKGTNEQNQKYDQTKNNLLRNIENLENENEHLKQDLQRLKRQHQQVENQYEKKLELILHEYENSAKQQKGSFDLAISRLKQQLQHSDFRAKQLADSYQKDKIDTQYKIKQAINLYNQQNEGLKAKLNHKMNEFSQLAVQFDVLKAEHQNCNAHKVNDEELNSIAKECNQLRQRCLTLEKEVSSLNVQILEMDSDLKDKGNYILELQDNIRELQEEKENLSKKHSDAQIKNNDLTVRSSRNELDIIDLQNKLDQLQRQITNNQNVYSSKISQLESANSALHKERGELNDKIYEINKELSTKATKIQRLENDLQRSTFRLQNQPMQEDLQELKKLVCECFLKIGPNAEKQIVQQFYKLNYLYEAKLEENLKLNKELQTLRAENLDLQKQHQIISQKISLLQQNNTIYQRQLKERRIMYDQLLNEKSRIERQTLLAKKIKVEQSQIQNSRRSNINQITSRIDQLLNLQRQRNQRLKGITVIRQYSPQRQHSP